MYKLINPLPVDSVIDLMVNVMQYALALVDVVALLMFIYGGFVMMTSRGNPEKIQKAKDTLLWAVIGILVITTSYTAIQYFLSLANRVAN